MSAESGGRIDGGIRGRLQVALRSALRDRDMAAASALRSALAAIGNAEAVGVAQAAAPAEGAGGGARAGSGSEHVAGAAAGLGAAEVARRELSEAELARIVAAEVAERVAAADGYEHAGHADRAERLRREADVLRAAAAPAAGPRDRGNPSANIAGSSP
jgi:uncharacterized protein YqeY